MEKANQKELTGLFVAHFDGKISLVAVNDKPAELEQFKQPTRMPVGEPGRTLYYFTLPVTEYGVEWITEEK